VFVILYQMRQAAKLLLVINSEHVFLVEYSVVV